MRTQMHKKEVNLTRELLLKQLEMTIQMLANDKLREADIQTIRFYMTELWEDIRVFLKKPDGFDKAAEISLKLSSLLIVFVHNFTERQNKSLKSFLTARNVEDDALLELDILRLYKRFNAKQTLFTDASSKDIEQLAIDTADEVDDVVVKTKKKPIN